jgi:hypothetical protein
MKSRNRKQIAVTESTEDIPIMSRTTVSRREFLAVSVAGSAARAVPTRRV